MADIVYTVNQDSPENIQGFEQYSQKDRALVNSFQINNTFNPTKNYSELHILSLSDELLQSDYNYIRYKQAAAAQSAGQDGTSALTIDPIEDSKTYGYTNGGVKLLYHFLDDLYSQDRSEVQFYIQDISADRTEVSLATLLIQPDDLVTITSGIKTKLESQSYFTGFRLNFKENDLLIATNIDTLDSSTGKVVVVKLYEPLPDRYNLKSTLNIVDLVSDSVAYEIEVEFILPPELASTLRSPNFNIDIADNSVIPTGYYNYNELFSYPINNSNSQLFSAVSEKGIDISIDFSDFSNFIHFSSAQERLLNFKYKLDLINSYSSSLSSIASSTTGLQGVSGSRDYYQNLLTGVVNNFDHYERFLYYESGSNSWPKSNTTKPYNNKASNAPEAITWYANEIANAIGFDNTNYSSLAYSIPTYLRDDENNENYLTFVYMVGQHFDNLWLYSKAVTDKYDADNRMNHGISKDLVAEALENFGVKLYTSNKSIEDLFTTFIGQAYQSGSEVITTYITGSLTGSNTPIQPVSYDNYQKEVQKRIYHNLPLLLKSKGTERGLRALINCLGIPSDILKIKLYGGRNRNETPFYGDYSYYTSSLDKIRLDNTGSIVTGSTLSNYVSIGKRDDKYTDDLHPIEVGFSPTDNVDNAIRLGTVLPNITIGTQVWSTTNLDGTTYRDGTQIPQVTDNTAWSKLTTGAWCYYDNRTDSGSVYGKLYNWYAVTDPRGIAPQGWRIPTDTEWTTLTDYLGGASVAGGKMKATGTALWRSPNSFATNTSGFTGLPGGNRLNNGTFVNTNTDGHWWSTTEASSNLAWSRKLGNTGQTADRNDNNKKHGFSVRLIQDITSNTFNIDDYIGDPRNLTSDTYYNYTPAGIPQLSLSEVSTQILSGSQVTGSYNVQDFIRLIKFFDNTIFKMVKDFIPARAVADTGIIIKPYILGRSKAKSAILSGSRPEYTGSIDTAFVEGGDGGIFRRPTGDLVTGYYDQIQTADGIVVNTNLHGQEQPKYNGEFSYSNLAVSAVDLNRDNPYKAITIGTYSFPIQFVSASLEVCTLLPYVGTYYVTSSTTIFSGPEFFNQGINSSVVYTTNISNAGGSTLVTPYIPAGFPRAFSNIAYNTTFNISASNVNSTTVGGCQALATVKFATCSLAESQIGALTRDVANANNIQYRISSWFDIHPDQVPFMQCTIKNVTTNNTIVNNVALNSSSLTNYIFNSTIYSAGDIVDITINDPNLGGICNFTKRVTVGICILGAFAAPPRGFDFIYSTYIVGISNDFGTGTSP